MRSKATAYGSDRGHKRKRGPRDSGLDLPRDRPFTNSSTETEASRNLLTSPSQARIDAGPAVYEKPYQAESLVACPIYIEQAANAESGVIRYFRSCRGIRDIYLLAQGHMLVLHGTREAVKQALYALPKQSDIKHIEHIDLDNLLSVNGGHTPPTSDEVESVSDQDMAEVEDEGAVCTYTLDIDRQARGALLGLQGTNLRALQSNLGLPSYPLLDHKSTLHLQGSKKQILAAVQQINNLFDQAFIKQKLVVFDSDRLREVFPDGFGSEDWKTFGVKLGAKAMRHFQVKDIVSIEWLVVRYDLVELTMHGLKNGSALLRMKGTKDAAHKLVRYLNRQLDALGDVGELRLETMPEDFRTQDLVDENPPLGPVDEPNTVQRRYRFPLPADWAHNHKSELFNRVRQSAKLRYCKHLRDLKSGQLSLMLYGTTPAIQEAVRQLNSLLLRKTPGGTYRWQAMDLNLLQLDTRDVNDPLCSWYRGEA